MIDAMGNPQSVLVLGGGSDIAKATVEALTARRCRSVVLAGRRPEVLDRVAGDLRRSNGIPAADVGSLEPRDRSNSGSIRQTTEELVIETIPFDALDRSSHEKVIAETFRRSGGIDLVIVAFAILGDQTSDELNPESAARVIDVNFTGAVSSMLAVIQQFRLQGRGTLVVLSSVAGVRVRKSNFIYGASKAGLDGFTQGLADSLEGTGIRVMLVRPGFVVTKMTEGMKKAPFSTTPDVVARAIVRGLESEASVVWVPSSLRYLMAIMTHLPRSIFRRIPT